MTHYVLDARTATPHFPGIGRYVTNLAAALAPLLATDERLTILHAPSHPLTLPSSPAVALLSVAAGPFGLAQQWDIPRLLRRLSADLYHNAYIAMPYAPGVPTVLTVYDLIPLLYPEQSSGRARRLAHLTNSLALRAANVVLAISEATRADYLAHFRVPAERIVTAPLAADPAFRPQSDAAVAALRARLALPERYVLYLGSNKPHKNLVGLVEAWRIANQRISESANHASRVTHHASHLAIAGAWDERYPEARQRVAALGLNDSVMFLGPVAEADLPALYSGAELFVFPSLYEGFGFPVLEAMACGTPVICSNVSSLPEVAGSAALQVDPRETDALAGAMDRVLSDAALREEMRRAGLAQAGRFSWTHTAQQTLDAYRRVLNEAN
jgi:glycosyltransferase involved in cell wall biosynthesis